MGFNNGYESGYSDALEDVRSGKVAGVGPSGGGAGATPSYMAYTDASRYADVVPGSVRASYDAPSSVTASYGNGALDFQVPAVPAGTIMKLGVHYEEYHTDGGYWDSSTDLTSLGLDGMVMVNGNVISGLGLPDPYSSGYATLVLWFDGTSWVGVTYEDYMP